MTLDEQIKVVFYSFIYGMFYYATYKMLKKITLRKKIKLLIEFLFSISHVLLFYILLFLINGGALSFYILIFFSLGNIFCRLLYFNN